MASLLCFVCKLGYLTISNLHKSRCRDFIMSIQEWKNHQTYLIFLHVLEVCFFEKARKNPSWVKKNVAKKMNFPQHNSPCFVLFQKPVFLLKIKNIFLVFYLHLGSSLFKIWYPTISIFIPHSNSSNLFSNLKSTKSRSVISTFKTWAISILKIWIEECQYDFYLKKKFF